MTKNIRVLLYSISVIVNRECPRVRPGYVGTCPEECGQWSAMNSTCVDGQSCCPNECGGHVCRPGKLDIQLNRESKAV